MIRIKDITEDLVATLSSIQGFGNKVFPMLAKEGTNLPFMTYTRIGIVPTSTKDGPQRKVSFQINVVSREYLEGVQVLDNIIQSVTRMGIFEHTDNNLKYTTTIDSSNEEAYDDGYAQTINLTLEATYA